MMELYDNGELRRMWKEHLNVNGRIILEWNLWK